MEEIQIMRPVGVFHTWKRFSLNISLFPRSVWKDTCIYLCMHKKKKKIEKKNVLLLWSSH